MTDSSDNAVIRSANEGDAQELARLFTLLGHPTAVNEVGSRWKEWSEAGNSALVAAGPHGTLAGMATLHRRIVLHQPLPIGRVTALVVDVSSRRQGVGRDLVAAAEAELINSGCGLLEVTSNASLVGAHAFWEHLGYERTSFRSAKVLSQR